MAQVQRYRGHSIVSKWNGWQIKEPGGAAWPETYGSITDAQKSIDFTLKNEKR